MLDDLPLLSLTVWTPVLGGVAVLLAGDKGDADGMRRLALMVSVATFILSIGLYTGFDASTADMQFVERSEWIAAFNIFYHFGVDSGHGNHPVDPPRNLSVPVTSRYRIRLMT